jgi:hypothetical protein
MKIYNPIRNAVVVLMVILAGTLTARAAVTVQAWYHLGEDDTLAGGTPQDSSGNGNHMTDGFSEFESIHVSANAPGGPLGTSGWTSTNSSEWGRNGDVIIAARDGYYVSGTNFGIEAWVLPFGNGYNIFCCEAQQQYTAMIFASGGDATGFVLGVTNNQDGTFSIAGSVILDSGLFAGVGNPVPLNTNAWTHFALVNDRGTNTFYVNGVATGPSTTDAPSTNVPTGTGNQNGMRLGASGGDHLAFRGLIDEARAFTFTSGAFAVSDLLYPSPSLTTPRIAVQPANTSVWDGGPAPFSVQVTTSPNLTYQWKRNGSNLAGQTQPTLLLPSVSHASDNGIPYSCAITNTSSGNFTLSSNAILSVPFVLTNNMLNYRSQVTNQTSLVAYFPVDFNSGTTLGNLKFPANTGTLEGAAGYDARTDRAFGQRSLAFDRSANLGDVMLANNAAYSFPSGVGTIEAIVYMSDLGVYLNSSLWTFPTIFSIGAPDTTIPDFSCLVGTSKTGDALEYSDGTTTTSWPVPKNLVGRFAHVALVFDQASGLTAYVDGRSLGTQASFTPATTSNPAWIGNAASYTNTLGGTNGTIWSGTIDELAIYTNALSASTLNSHYAMLVYGTNSRPVILSQPSSVTIFAGAANNNATFSVDAEGTLPLTYQWFSNNVVIPGATTPALTISNATPSSSAAYSVTVTNTVGSTNVSATLAVITPTGYAAAVTADHPVGYWRLGEASGPAALDSWGTHDGTYSGKEIFGRPGALVRDSNTSVDFAGDGASLVRVPYSSDLNGGLDPNGSWTVECWANLDLDAATEGFAVPVASCNAVGSDRSGYFFLVEPDGWQFRMGNTSGYIANWNGAAGSFGGTPQSNTWYHLVGQYDGAAGNGYVYINGVQVKSNTAAGFAQNGTATFCIGDRGDGTTYAGRVDEVAVYTGLLSASRIAAHYYAGQPPQIIITRNGNNVSLSWPTGVGVLYGATDAAGPYTVVSPVSNPYPVPLAGRHFYLLRAQ